MYPIVLWPNPPQSRRIHTSDLLILLLSLLIKMMTVDLMIVFSIWRNVHSRTTFNRQVTVTVNHNKKDRQYINRPFSQLSSSSGEHAEQRILAHKSEQPTVGCIGIFHKYGGYIKHGGIITNLNLWIPWGNVSVCQNAMLWVCGACIRLYYLLC